VLQARVHRVAEAGRLRVTERRAVELIQAAGTGVVFTLIDQAEDERDDTLADTAWESVCATILTDASTAAITGPAAAAVTLRAALPDLTALAERGLRPSAPCSATGSTASRAESQRVPGSARRQPPPPGQTGKPDRQGLRPRGDHSMPWAPGVAGDRADSAPA
jgi:hypothetical protein